MIKTIKTIDLQCTIKSIMVVLNRGNTGSGGLYGDDVENKHLFRREKKHIII